MNDFNPNLIYQRIQDACRDNKTTITALCKSLTGSQGNLVTWKKGNIRIEHLLKISHYTNVSLDYLTGITDIKEKTPKTGSINAENAFGTITMSVTEEEAELKQAYRTHLELHAAIRRMLEIEESDKKEKAVNPPIRVAARSGKDYSIDGEEDTEIKVL